MANQTVYRSLADLPLVLRVADVASVLGIGRGMAYTLVCKKAIRSIRAGSRILIPRDELIRFLNSPAA